MGIFGALTTAVSGLRANAFALENISGNIANSQTTAYKRVDTTFQDIVGAVGGDPTSQSAGLVQSKSRATNNQQGDILAGKDDTSIAIDGDGYFIVQESVGQTDGVTIFSGLDVYTRRGDFEIDKDGYLVNTGGYYLKGLDVDATTGNTVGSAPKVIQLQSDFIPAIATSTIEYTGNLPETPAVSTADGLVDFANVLGGGGGAGLITDDVELADESNFLAQTISGGSLTTYDANGTPINLTFRWAKIADIDTPSPSDDWRLFYQSDSTTVTATDPTWTNTGTTYSFNASGNLIAPVGATATFPVTVDGASLGTVTFNNGTSGLTQAARPDGLFDDNGTTHNGFPSGELAQIRFGSGGQINATYTNGRTIPIAEIPIVSFSADSRLARLSGGAFGQTQESGSPQFGGSGAIIGNALEASNTDIAEEFSKLIITQQAYTANTRIVTTADEMLTEALNIVR